MQNEQTPKDAWPPLAEDRKKRVYAGFFVRLTAYLIDKLILCVPLLVLRAVIGIISLNVTDGLLTKDIIFSFSAVDLILYFAGVAYFILMTYGAGRTIGKRLMKIRVVSKDDRKPTLFEIFFRETFGRFLSSVVLCIGYLIIGAGDEKEALHDHLADTRVIYEFDS
ncbi:MAG: RDD family protein [Eubacterium sp.]|nr:RDD family protein [Eubacterium sp.]